MIHSLVLATHNAGKIKELQALLAPIICLPQSHFDVPEAEETGLTFIENAILKARHAAKLTKKPAIADDSGLVVPALNNRPGLYSARFAPTPAGQKPSDSDNRQFLLAQMTGISDRNAYFYCVLALLLTPEDPAPLIAIGTLPGIILEEEKGQQGFGYDPIFFLPDYQKTLAEMTLAEKNIISHRAQALKTLSVTLANEAKFL